MFLIDAVIVMVPLRSDVTVATPWPTLSSTNGVGRKCAAPGLADVLQTATNFSVALAAARRHW